jgi:hypothetical protein
VIHRNAASVTPSIGERPIIGVCILVQKFIAVADQDSTAKRAKPAYRSMALTSDRVPTYLRTNN